MGEIPEMDYEKILAGLNEAQDGIVITLQMNHETGMALAQIITHSEVEAETCVVELRNLQSMGLVQRGMRTGSQKSGVIQTTFEQDDTGSDYRLELAFRDYLNTQLPPDMVI